MSLSTSRRTWEEASSPAAVRLAREYEQAWRDSHQFRHRPDPDDFLDAAGSTDNGPGARLALLRADMALRWEAGEKPGTEWYLDRYSDLSEDTIVALAYEEYCLREEDGEKPDPADYLVRFTCVARPLRRVLEIHELVGSGSTATALALSPANAPDQSESDFPEAGQIIDGFVLVEELGRGAFARVFLARERQLADRPVALKVTRRGSREPQTLARLQHTHIVPVHSHRIDRATGLHLLCMPYFGRITLARVLAECRGRDEDSGSALVEALDRLEPPEAMTVRLPAGRRALYRRSYFEGIAWWGARLAEALVHAHDRGVLHRDIKPSNVLVTSDGMPMLLDFNLAREPVAEDETAGDSDALGGTIDYMAPEHLTALAGTDPESVDGRSDIFGLGVVLYEAVTGRRPYASPRRGFSIVDALLRAADERQTGPAPPRDIEPDLPQSLDAVIRRCLEPDPDFRYQTAADLAADLQAVADDLPLQHAREPWSSRAGGWVRRRRRRLAVGSALVLAGSAMLAALAGIQLERAESAKIVENELVKAKASYDGDDYRTAKEHYDAALALINHLDNRDLRNHLTRLPSFPQIVRTLAAKLRDLQAGPNLAEMKDLARDKGQLAGRYAQTRRAADDLFDAAARLRFRLLLGKGPTLTRAVEELGHVFEPFYVLQAGDWTKLEHIRVLLDQPRLDRLRIEVNELFFLWVATIDRELFETRSDGVAPLPTSDRKAAATAVELCERALTFVDTKEPWRALMARLERAAKGSIGEPTASREQILANFPGEPVDVEVERSALACFEWAVRYLRADSMPRAIEWMRQAVRLNPGNYWYQFFLAYVEDQADRKDDALAHYSAALALEPNSPWVRFSRARLYRAKGRWSWAIDDLKIALRDMARQPEEPAVHLELGFVYQQLGDFARARSEYDLVVSADPTDDIGRAARLNCANIDVESGAIDRARREYDALIRLEPKDAAVWESRARLALWMGQAGLAEGDLSVLLEKGYELKDRSEILAARAQARILLGRSSDAMTDAAEALRKHPCPAHERLWQRTLLAAHRFEELQLDRPEAIAAFPLGGRRLAHDLRTAASDLARLGAGTGPAAFRALNNLSVVLAALGDTSAALETSSQALCLAPFSADACLIRARLHAYAGDCAGAWSAVERGLAIKSDHPGLIQFRGVLRHAAGDPLQALADYQIAISRGALDGVHSRKASAFVALGQYDEAVLEWSIALRQDAELPEAFLGRAQTYLRIRQRDLTDLALADLEQAASWAHSDPRLEIAIATAYLRCLISRPERLARWLMLARRATNDLWQSLSNAPGP
jgi:serine/threonine protein kinase/tetratricopeptide (TPR) repeat protein